MLNFSQAKIKFDTEYGSKKEIAKSLVTVDGKYVENISIKDVNNKPNEELDRLQLTGQFF